MPDSLPSGRSSGSFFRSPKVAAILPDVSAGLTTGLVTLVYSISYAALVFSDTLAPFFPQGIGVALIGATLTASIVSWRSSFRFALGGLDSSSSILVALMTSAIATILGPSGTAEQLYATVWLTIVLSTVLTGGFLFILGWLRLGQWARFIPYPVIGGFLAGSGWLITRSSFKVMVGFPLEIAQLDALMQPITLSRWLIGLLFACVLFVGLGRYKHFWVLPSLLTGSIACFDGLWWIGDRLFGLNRQGWFFEPFSTQDIWKFWHLSTLTQVNWEVSLSQSGALIVMMLIVVISIVLNATGLELATAQQVDLNRELQTNGLANLATGLCGGMVGHLSLNRSLLNRQAGAKRPVAALISGGMCAAVLLVGSDFLVYLPKPILGGLLFYIGLNMLRRWGYQSRLQFPQLDYALILLILLVIAVWGFLQGVGAGIVIACFLFIFNYGRTPFIKHELSGTTLFSNVRRSIPQQTLLQQKGDCVYTLVLQGFLFFGTANALLETVCSRLDHPDLPKLKFVVVDFRQVNGIDSSVVLSFIKMQQIAQKSQLSLVFTELQPAIQQQFTVGRLLQPDGMCQSFPDLDQGLEWCENQILDTANLRRSRFIPLEMQPETAFPDLGLIVQLVPYLKPVTLEAGDYLFRQGDVFDGLYFLEFGRLSIVLSHPDGRMRRICAYTPVVTVGEMEWYQQTPRTASVIADQHSILRFLSTESFELIQTQEPILAARFHTCMALLLTLRLQERDQTLSSLMQ